VMCWKQMRAADAKAAKTSTNLGTKFQQTQQMWSRPTRSMTQVISFISKSPFFGFFGILPDSLHSRLFPSQFWIPDSGFWIPDSGFWIPDSGFWIFDLRFWILDSGFSILDSGFEILDFGFWILDSGFWILNSGF